MLAMRILMSKILDNRGNLSRAYFTRTYLDVPLINRDVTRSRQKAKAWVISRRVVFLCNNRARFPVIFDASFCAFRNDKLYEISQRLLR